MSATRETGRATEPTGTAPSEATATAQPLKGTSHEIALSPLPPSDESRALGLIQTRLKARITEGARGELATRERVFSLLPDELGEYGATAAPVAGPTEAEGKPVAGALRRYKRDQQDLLVRVVDTARAPGLLAPIVDQLLLQGQGPWGEQRGAMLSGQPAIVRAYASGGASVMLIVADRYLVELRLRGKPTQEDLVRVTAALPLTGLAANGGAGQGG